MALTCPGCAQSTLTITHALELPPDDRVDERTVQLVACAACKWQGVGAYEASRRGHVASERAQHEARPVQAVQYQALLETLRRCPAPANRQCRCATHQQWNRTVNGRWQGLPGLKTAPRFLRPLIVMGTLLGGWLAVIMLTSQERWWMAAGAVLAVSVIASAAGVWRWRRWALYLSWATALAVLVFGAYGAHFAWTFWLFEEPTLARRLAALLRPLVLLSLILPLAWLWYSTRRSLRALFAARPTP